jgi:hypothetical protein
MFRNPDVGQLQWKIYYKTEVPNFGLGTITQRARQTDG